jgi:hypothetical protein
MLIITHSIYVNEYEPLEKTFSINVVRCAARHALGGLGIEIKNTGKIPYTKLKKVKLTSSGGAGRCVFLLQMKDNVALLVAIRTKNDKKIGENMTVKNHKFVKLLERHYKLIFDDIASGRYYEYQP